MTKKTIPFIDLGAQRRALRREIDEAVQAVLDGGQYIMGVEVQRLEQVLKTFVSSRHCVTNSSGTHALQLILMAWGIGPGDAVFVPSLTFIATAEVVSLLGATPVFVDVDDRTFTMDPESLEPAIRAAEAAGLRAEVVIPVDFNGLPADYAMIGSIARDNGLRLLADAAQSFGAMHPLGPVGTLGDATATSFYPAKPLGCYGDGGAVFTDDDSLAGIIESLRQHGRNADKYDHQRLGVNARLDTIQAAILLVKLKAFPNEFARRQKLAAIFAERFQNLFEVPYVPDGFQSAWAIYTLKALDTAARDRARRVLQDVGVPTGIYYPRPLHLQIAYANAPHLCPDDCPTATDLTGRIFSIPFHPYMDDETIVIITEAMQKARL